MANLLTYPSLVESPFIEVTIGDYTFGTYSKDMSTGRTVYPNFLNSLSITKVNGQVNQYTISMIYQITPGDDPNFLDKVFSSVGYDKLIEISYGDWKYPTLIYKKEQAIITKISATVDFANSRITYTVSCTSNALALIGTACNFGKFTAKPSDAIKTLLNDKSYGLLDIFTGMASANRLVYNYDEFNVNSLIASDDQVVEIEAQQKVDALYYLNYLVSCMVPNDGNGVYKLSIHDDTFGSNASGPYFKVVKVPTKVDSLSVSAAYTVDIGYPSDNMVVNFSIKDDNSWALIYKYSDSLNQQNYVYSIDNQGNMVTSYSPNITTVSSLNKTTDTLHNWWKEMTEFPISAELTVKGLVRSAMLMSYIKINSYFYGNQHVSSGLYIVTAQRDDISMSGYRTTLSLVRVAGDGTAIDTTPRQPHEAMDRSTVKYVSYDEPREAYFARKGATYYLSSATIERNAIGVLQEDTRISKIDEENKRWATVSALAMQKSFGGLSRYSEVYVKYKDIYLKPLSDEYGYDHRGH